MNKILTIIDQNQEKFDLLEIKFHHAPRIRIAFINHINSVGLSPLWYGGSVMEQ